MENLRPNAARAKAIVNMIWIILVLDIISIASDCYQLDLLFKLQEGVEVSETTAATADFIDWAITIIALIAYIISVVAFIRWFRRAYYNMGTLMGGGLTHSEGWAAGGWFVPILNLYVPYQIMEELYRKADQILLYRQNENYTTRLKTSYVKWWWAVWLICGIIGRIFLQTMLKAETVTQLIDSAIFSIIISGLDIILCLITIIVVKDYAEAEALLTDSQDGNELPPEYIEPDDNIIKSAEPYHQE